MLISAATCGYTGYTLIQIYTSSMPCYMLMVHKLARACIGYTVLTHKSYALNTAMCRGHETGETNTITHLNIDWY